MKLSFNKIKFLPLRLCDKPSSFQVTMRFFLFQRVHAGFSPCSLKKIPNICSVSIAFHDFSDQAKSNRYHIKLITTKIAELLFLYKIFSYNTLFGQRGLSLQQKYVQKQIFQFDFSSTLPLKLKFPNFSLTGNPSLIFFRFSGFFQCQWKPVIASKRIIKFVLLQVYYYKCISLDVKLKAKG